MPEVIVPPSYPTWKRYLISGGSVFLAGFLTQLALELASVDSPADLTGKFVFGLVMGALLAGIYAIIKWLREKQAGMI